LVVSSPREINQTRSNMLLVWLISRGEETTKDRSIPNLG